MGGRGSLQCLFITGSFRERKEEPQEAAKSTHTQMNNLHCGRQRPRAVATYRIGSVPVSEETANSRQRARQQAVGTMVLCARVSQRLPVNAAFGMALSKSEQLSSQLPKC